MDAAILTCNLWGINNNNIQFSYKSHSTTQTIGISGQNYLFFDTDYANGYVKIYSAVNTLNV